MFKLKYVVEHAQANKGHDSKQTIYLPLKIGAFEHSVNQGTLEMRNSKCMSCGGVILWFSRV